MIDLNANPITDPINANYSLQYCPVNFERAASTFIDTTTYHDCCEFLTNSAGQQFFTPVTTADALEVVSTSASDTAAGVGTRTVGIVYLDANGIWSEATVTLNGTTAVPLTGITASAINFMYAKTGGTTPTGVGVISLRKVGTPTLIYEQITANGNMSQSGRFTVPAGYIAKITSCTVSCQGQGIEFKLRSTSTPFNDSTAGRFLFKKNIKLPASGYVVLPFSNFYLTAGQQVKASALADATTGNPRIHGTFEVELIKL